MELYTIKNIAVQGGREGVADENNDKNSFLYLLVFSALFQYFLHFFKDRIF